MCPVRVGSAGMFRRTCSTDVHSNVLIGSMVAPENRISASKLIADYSVVRPVTHGRDLIILI